MVPPTNNADVLDTRFRSALRRMTYAGRLHSYDAPVDPVLEVGGIMKRLDGGPAILFTRPKGYEMPILGNLLASKENVEAAFGTDFRAIRQFVGRALGNPLPPQVTSHAPVQEVVQREDIDLGAMFPALQHAPGDAGRYFTAGIVIVRDPRTGVYNASYHRLLIVGRDRLAIKLDYGRHLRFAFERAKEAGRDLEVVVVLGADIALHYTAATMGSQMPENADELAVSGGLSGRALPVAQAVTVDLVVPADAEMAMEGRILTGETALEGPFGEFVGFPAPAEQAPVLVIDCITRRRKPIYHAINGYGRETVMLRKYVLEASLLKAVQPAVPIVTDAEMTAGGMHRFHAVVQVRKTSPQHEGLQRNAILAAFGALKDLDQVTVVDDDIDIRDPMDVEYALATRFEASNDLLVIPGARGHEYVRASKGGIRAKLGIDATVPFEERDRFRRIDFADVSIDQARFGTQPDEVSRWLDD